MKDRAPLAVAIVAALLVFLTVRPDPSMLRDSDTAVLLRALDARGNPWSWFVGDWPLENRFYRPLPSLLFEWDLARSGADPRGYAITNALLAALAVLGTYWAIRELTDRRPLAAGAAILVAIWHLDLGGRVAALASPLVWIATLLAAGLAIGRREWPWRAIPVFLVGMLLVEELGGLSLLRFRTIDWLPGRTAMTMTVFALLATAAYARYERLSARRALPEPGPLDPPATRSTAALADPRPATPWAIVSLLAVAAALASYEQAVMLPAVFLGIAIAFRMRGYRVRWGWTVGTWLLLGGYLLLRKAVIPAGVSGYQAQQLRSTGGAMLALSDYVLPAAARSFVAIAGAEGGVLYWLTPSPWTAIVAWARTVAVVIAARRDWLWPFAGWLLSAIAFLPMAWLKPFEHYHQWPMTWRALFVVALAGVAWRTAVSGCSRRCRPAPPRSDPAPGSLPRP